MATAKGRPATGRRVPTVFGSKKIKRGGKDVTIQLISKIAESTIKALDIKLKPAGGGTKTPSLVKSKGAKPKMYLPRSGGTSSGKRSLLCSADGIAFYSVIVPNNCSYSLAMTTLAKESKAIVFKTPAGGAQIVGDASKLKAKTATKKKAAKK